MKLPYEYIETESFEKGFAAYYKKHIVPLSQRYEPQRLKNKKLHIYRILFSLLTGSLGSGAILKSAWFLKLHARKKGNILLLPFLFLWWLFVERPKISYFSIAKAQIVPKILKFYGGFKYQTTSELKDVIIAKHMAYSSIFLGKTQDVIEYKDGKIQIQIAEITNKNGFKDYKGNLLITLESKINTHIDLLIYSAKDDKYDRQKYEAANQTPKE